MWGHVGHGWRWKEEGGHEGRWRVALGPSRGPMGPGTWMVIGGHRRTSKEFEGYAGALKNIEDRRRTTEGHRGAPRDGGGGAPNPPNCSPSTCAAHLLLIIRRCVGLAPLVPWQPARTVAWPPGRLASSSRPPGRLNAWPPRTPVPERLGARPRHPLEALRGHARPLQKMQ
jgi:hypothetical protein